MGRILCLILLFAGGIEAANTPHLLVIWKTRNPVVIRGEVYQPTDTVMTADDKIAGYSFMLWKNQYDPLKNHGFDLLAELNKQAGKLLIIECRKEAVTDSLEGRGYKRKPELGIELGK